MVFKNLQHWYIIKYILHTYSTIVKPKVTTYKAEKYNVQTVSSQQSSRASSN